MTASIAGSTKAIALIAHDKQKAALLDFARRHRAVLATNLGSAEALVCSLIPPA